MSSFPPPPVNTIDWSNLGFKIREVNGHIESHYSVSTGRWTPPRFVADPYLRIHGMAPGLNYGQQCYEGLKAFRTPGDLQIVIFRPDQNAKRMQSSCEVVSIPAIPEAHFLECVRLAVALNAEFVPPHLSGGAMYVRPHVFGSCAQLGLSPPEEYTFVVYVVPTGVYHGVHPIDGLVLEDFDRAAPHGTGNAKIGGNYAPVLRFSERARRDGYGITLHLDSATRTEVDEFSTSGFIGVKRTNQSITSSTTNETTAAALAGNASTEPPQYTLVVPDSKCAIKSVTSDSVCRIAREIKGWTVEKRPVLYEELATFEEVMAAGTAAALVPLKSLSMLSKGDKFVYGGGGDEPGPVCAGLLATLKGIQTGKIADTFGWLDIVQYPTDFVETEKANAKMKTAENGSNGLTNGTT